MTSTSGAREQESEMGGSMARAEAPGSTSLRSPEPVPVSAHAGNDPSRREPGSEFFGTTFETRAERAEREGFAPCPTCHQYSHSIGEDRLAEAFRWFQSMYAHPVRGHPMGHCFDDKTRDFAQILMAAARAATDT